MRILKSYYIVILLKNHLHFILLYFTLTMVTNQCWVDHDTIILMSTPFPIIPMGTIYFYNAMLEINDIVERGSSVVECQTRNQVSAGSNPPLLPFQRLGIFVLSIDAPVDSAV